jgi:sulfur relay protein TusB/DsrH
MGNLYLVDKPYGANGLTLAAEDEEASVVLIQDGVYLDVSEVSKAGRPLYAVKRDIERRGLENRLPTSVKAVGFDELVDLIVDHKVVNFA